MTIRVKAPIPRARSIPKPALQRCEKCGRLSHKLHTARWSTNGVWIEGLICGFCLGET